MKGFGTVLAAVMATSIAFLLCDVTYAFHEGGVGYCVGCHNNRSSQNDSVPGQDEGVGSVTGRMLNGPDPSSTCLACHAEKATFYNVFSTDGSRYTPGGDFYWLNRTFSWTDNGRYNESPGDSHGHNIVAAKYGLKPDTRLLTAPGGTYPAMQLGCISCHDPHGRITGNTGNGAAISRSGSYGLSPAEGTITGNYRLLGGVGYSGGGQASGIPFPHPAPVAVANAHDWSETDTQHPAYGAGMSEWCANCHEDFLMVGAGRGGSMHPSGNQAKLSPEVIANYNSYIKTGDLSGTQGSAYLALVPFEPAGNANVMCLTCHRAHASAFRNLGRWDFTATFIAASHPQAGDAGATGMEALHSYYGRDMIAEFGRYQRQLCNKCHVRD
jgi:hypothetical protein